MRPNLHVASVSCGGRKLFLVQPGWRKWTHGALDQKHSNLFSRFRLWWTQEQPKPYKMQKQTEAHPPATYLCSPNVDQSHNNVRQHDLDSHVLAEKRFLSCLSHSLPVLPFLKFPSFLMWAVYHALHCFKRGSSLKDAVRCRWSLDMRQGSQMHVCLFVCKTHNLQNRTSCPGLALKRISAASTTKLQQSSQAKFRRRWRPGFKIWMTRLMNRLSMTQQVCCPKCRVYIISLTNRMPRIRI